MDYSKRQPCEDMKLIDVERYSSADKDIRLHGGDIKVDYDDVDRGEATALCSLIRIAPEMLDLCYDFVLKCHLGLARSKETYGKMKAILDEYHGYIQANYVKEDDE